MRTLSSAQQAALLAKYTQPGYLVEMSFSTKLRYTTRTTLTFDTFSWTAADVKVGDFNETPNGAVTASLSVGNTDLAFGALCLSEDPQERAVRIWQYDAAAVATADFLLRFEGVIDSAEIGADRVVLSLSQASAGNLYLPRHRVTRTNGFINLAAAGRVIQFGTSRYKLER